MSPSCSSQSGPTSRYWKVTSETRPPKRDADIQPMGKYVFWRRHKGLLPRARPRGNQVHQRPPEQVEHVPGTMVLAVLLLAPSGLKTTLRPGRAHGSLWMLPPPTASNFCLPPLRQDALTGTHTTCRRCGPQALATPWPLLQLLERCHHTPTADATPEQHHWLHTQFKQASAEDTATVAWGPGTAAEGRFHQGTWDTKHPAITFLVLAKHRSTASEAPAYPVKHLCSQVQDWQTIKSTTFHPQKAYLLQYVYGYLTQGHEGNNDYVRMNPEATEIIPQGIGVYCTRRLQPATNTPWATTEQGACVHTYQLTRRCRLPCPDDRNTVIFADASGTRNLTPAAREAALELETEAAGRLRQQHLTGATIFGTSSHKELKTLAIIVDTVNDVHQQQRDHAHHVWVVVDAAVDFQIVRKMA